MRLRDYEAVCGEHPAGLVEPAWRPDRLGIRSDSRIFGDAIERASLDSEGRVPLG